MRTAFVTFLIFLSICFSCRQKHENLHNQYQIILKNACEFLWRQQSEDGGWHSDVHGLMAGGQALTPFVLKSLLQIPDSIYPKKQHKIDGALDFLRNHINSSGVLGLSDPDILEYPNYSTAYALMVLVEFGNVADSILINRMKNYLIDQQFDESRGIEFNNLAYGGWGFGEQNLPLGESGHVDLAHTRRVLQALRIADENNENIYLKAEQFLSILQKHPSEKRNQPGVIGQEIIAPSYDGGFYYSPLVLGANKAKQELGNQNQAFFKSYATTTCDGLLSLLEAGYTMDDEKVKTAIKWLKDYPNI